MSKSNVTERNEEKEIGSLLQLLVLRLPKKNHDAMVQFGKQINDLFREHGNIAPEGFPTQQHQDQWEYGLYQHCQYCLSQSRRGGLGRSTLLHRSQAAG